MCDRARQCFAMLIDIGDTGAGHVPKTQPSSQLSPKEERVEMSFYDEISKLDLDKFKDVVESRTDADVERALSKTSPLDVEDFAALISENARIHYLKDMQIF